MPADVVRKGLRQPTMWLSRDAKTMKLEGWAQKDIDETLTTIQTTFNNLPSNGYFIKVPGMFHQDFSDAPLLSPLTSWLGITGPINSRLAHDIVSSYSLAFFDRYLKGRPVMLLDGLKDKFPNVIVKSR